MASKLPKPGSQPPPPRNHSEVRPAPQTEERRHAGRWPSDAQVELLGPIKAEAMALDVSSTGLQIVLSGWLSTGTLCDLRITTHSGRHIFKRAQVIWARRVGDECVAGLHFIGSIIPPAPTE
jgi:hypothetical protein